MNNLETLCKKKSLAIIILRRMKKEWQKNAFFLPSSAIGIMYRDVTKISSCRVNTTSKQGIKQLGISFGSIFLLFSYESSWEVTFIAATGILAPSS